MQTPRFDRPAAKSIILRQPLQFICYVFGRIVNCLQLFIVQMFIPRIEICHVTARAARCYEYSARYLAVRRESLMFPITRTFRIPTHRSEFWHWTVDAIFRKKKTEKRWRPDTRFLWSESRTNSSSSVHPAVFFSCRFHLMSIRPPLVALGEVNTRFKGLFSVGEFNRFP